MTLDSPVRIPTADDAKHILFVALQKRAVSCHRFPTGLAHYVFDITTDSGEHVVVRLGRSDLSHFIQGAMYWYDKLKMRDVPLPEIYFADSTGKAYGFPVMIMQRLPGSDLGEVYPHLSREQKQHLAQEITRIQKQVSTLPLGKGFGYARSDNDPHLYTTWENVLQANLQRSRQRIIQAGVIDVSLVNQVEGLLPEFEEYLSHISPVCFLDDTTTKNVIIHDGHISGIVDVDSVAYGDPLYTVALTHMSLLAKSYDTDYIIWWLEALGATLEQKQVFLLYTAVFCLDFLSEMGQKFNKVEPEPIDKEKVAHLTGILDDLVKELRSFTK